MAMCSLIIEPRNIESQIADSDPVYKPLIIKTSPRPLRSLRLIIYGESYGMSNAKMAKAFLNLGLF